MLTAFGAAAAATMVTAYALESRGNGWILVFAAGCLGTAIYGVATEAWIFAVLETLWAGIAISRWTRTRHQPPPTTMPVTSSP